MNADIKKEFIESCNMHSDALFRYAFFKTGNRELAQDLVQETFMKSWNYLAKGERLENTRAFFYKILTNLIIDEYRKKKPISLDNLEENGFDQGADESKSHFDKLDAEKALLLLGDLGGTYKDLVMMRYVDDLSLRDISYITGESENTIAVKIHRALKKIKQIIESKNQNKQ